MSKSGSKLICFKAVQYNIDSLGNRINYQDTKTDCLDSQTDNIDNPDS